MNRIAAIVCTLAGLFASERATAQLVLVNYIPTPAGAHEVPSGSLVYVRNTTDKPVTISIPYEPPIVLEPGQSHRFVVNPNPGGSTGIEGSGGAWRLDAS
jgi:hypothetical protein